MKKMEERTATNDQRATNTMVHDSPPILIKARDPDIAKCPDCGTINPDYPCWCEIMP